MIPKKILLTSLVIVGFLMLATVAQAQQTGVIRVNSNEEIVLDKSAWVGKTLLPAGTYHVHSHGSGANEQVHFEQEIMLTEVHPEYSSVIVYDELGKVDCDTVARSKAAEVTALHFVDDNGVMRIVSADIKGQAHSHVF